MSVGYLERYLRLLGIADGDVPTADEWCAFLSRVRDLLETSDQSRRLTDRSLHLASEELRGALDTRRLPFQHAGEWSDTKQAKRVAAIEVGHRAPALRCCAM